MKQIFAQKNFFCLPWAQTILGTHFQGKVNFMALDWLTRVNITPPMLGVCVNKGHASHAAILATGEYSINLPTREMIAKTDYVGLVSGRDIDKSSLFEVFYGELTAAPMISECPLTIECRLFQTVSLPTHSFFIAEMVNIFAEEEVLTEGKPDMRKIKPFLLSMPENTYWALGEEVGKAWSVGKEFKKPRE